MLVVWVHTVGTSVGIGRFRVGGYHGVLLFFVISGFLITGILLDARATAAERGTSWGAVLRAFYARRFLRIFPIYYLVLVLALAAGLPTVREAIAWHLTYLSNWYFAWRGGFDVPTSHLWSLAVEEQFYLVWPWFVLLLPQRALAWTIGAMVLTGPLSRLALAGMGVAGVADWITTPTVLDALGLGCLLAYAWRATESSDVLARWAGISGVLLLIGEMLLARVGTPRFVLFSISPLGWALLCVWMVHRAARGVSGWPGRLLRAWPLVYVGTISYGIYLMHVFPMPVVMWIEHRSHVSLPGWAHGGRPKFVIVMVISVAAATLSWKFFEGPINSLKRLVPYVKGPDSGHWRWMQRRNPTMLPPP